MNEFLKMLKGFLTSKKAVAMLVGIVVTLLIEFIPALEPMQENMTEIISIIAAYILGQGLADFGKHAK